MGCISSKEQPAAVHDVVAAKQPVELYAPTPLPTTGSPAVAVKPITSPAPPPAASNASPPHAAAAPIAVVPPRPPAPPSQAPPAPAPQAAQQQPAATAAGSPPASSSATAADAQAPRAPRTTNSADGAGSSVTFGPPTALGEPATRNTNGSARTAPGLAANGTGGTQAIGRFRPTPALRPQPPAALSATPTVPEASAAPAAGAAGATVEVLRAKRTSKLRERRGGVEGGQGSFVSLQSSLATDTSLVPLVSTRAAGVKHIGFGPLKRENQDEFFIQVGNYGGLPGANLFCVFDGHGSHGKHAADMSRQTLPVLLDNEMRTYFSRVSNPEDGIKGAVEVLISEVFGETERSLQKAGVNLSNSGTTASVAYQQGNRVWVASAGDSRVIMCCHMPDGSWRPQPLTIDHRPRRPSERMRVEAAGGRVAPKRLASGRCVGEPRIWLQDIPRPGLLLSRSLGDLMAASVGCTSDPEITYVTARPGVDVYMVMASDGVWDVLSNEEVCDIVVDSREPHLGCRRVLDAALYEWQERMSADNITVLVVEFDWEGTPMPSGARTA